MKTLRETIAKMIPDANEEACEIVADCIMVVIQKEVKECLPKELIGQPNTLGVQGSIGYNQALSDMEKNLKERGLI